VGDEESKCGSETGPTVKIENVPIVVR